MALGAACKSRYQSYKTKTPVKLQKIRLFCINLDCLLIRKYLQVLQCTTLSLENYRKYFISFIGLVPEQPSS